MTRFEKLETHRRKDLHKNLELRASILQYIRQFFVDNRYLEVETPIRVPAPAPEAHIDAQSSEGWYLQTSPELCMKRLLAAGYPRIFQICKCFRKDERGSRHLTELTMLEWYTVGQDYTEMMNQCEELIIHIAGYLGRNNIIQYQGRRIDLTLPWHRITVADAFNRWAGISVERALDDDRFEEILALKIEPRLGNDKPLFLYDYPVACGALARLKSSNRQLAERFELYIGGLELCNAFSELIDPDEQRKRFEAERELRRSAGKPVYPMPEEFLYELEYMPDAAGNALGIDRLIMLFADTKRIDDVVSFVPEEL
jgi:lysyl-tRNA synthetase class 2